MTDRLYIALDLDRTDGRGAALDVLVEWLRTAMPAQVVVDDAIYDAVIAGVGTSLTDLKNSLLSGW